MEEIFDMRPSGQAFGTGAYDRDRKIDIRRGLSFRYDDNRGVSRKTAAVSILIALLVLAVPFAYRWQGGVFQSGGEARAIAGPGGQEAAAAERDGNIWDLEYSNGGDPARYGTLLVVSRQESRAIVYKEDIKKGDRETVLEFDRDVAGQSVQSAEAALSPDKKNIAYAAKDGLRLYDLASGEDKLLFKKENGSDRPFGLAKPEWSSDGRFLSFVQVFSENLQLVTIEVRHPDRFAPVRNPAGETVAGLSARWAPESDLIIVPESEQKNRPGVFVSSMEKSDAPDGLGGQVGKYEGGFYEAAISADGTRAAFTYGNGFAQMPSDILAVSDIAGGGFSVLDKEGKKALPFFSPGGKLIFFISGIEEGAPRLLSIDTETKKRREVGALPRGYGKWSDPRWLDGRYLVISGGSPTPDGGAVFLMLDIENMELLHKKELGGGETPIGLL